MIAEASWSKPVYQVAAKVVGGLYLGTMLTAVAALNLSSPLIIAGDAAHTAASIIASEPLFRLSILMDLTTAVGVLALVSTLYLLLITVSRGWALFAILLRVTETIVFVVASLSYFALLVMLSRSPFLAPINPSTLQELGYAFVRLHGAVFQVGFVFLGCGSTIFAWLWWKSRYIPRTIAAWGVFSSLLMAIVSTATLVWPVLVGVVGLFYMLPLAVFEIGLGFWLLIRGLQLDRLSD